MTKAALAGFAALAIAAGALWLLDGVPGARDEGGNLVTLPTARSDGLTRRVTATPARRLGDTGLSHREPPPLDALANDVARQAAYDAEAKPGEFVTPPNVSIAH